MKARFVALAVAATLGLGSVSAFAQDYHRGDRAWQHQRADQGRRDWGNHQRYEAPRYYGSSRGYGRDNGDLVGALVIGAITGAVLGQAANNYNYNAAPPAYYAPPPATYYNPGYGYGYGYYGN